MAAIIALVSSGVGDAATPDAGQLLREQQPQRQLPQKLPQTGQEESRPAHADSGVNVLVKKIVFTGYEGLVTESDLQKQVAGVLNTELTYSGLQGVADTVTAYLRSQGWFLARAYLPKQDVTAGTIAITVIQGKSDGSLQIRRDKSVRLDDAVLRRVTNQAVKPGEPLNEQRLERAVMLLNDLPGVSAKASLIPGNDPGTTGIQLDVSEGARAKVTAGTDNQGNRYTGSWRGNLALNLNDMTGRGDQLNLMTTEAEGLFQGSASYTVPLAANGLKSSFSYTYMRYDLLEELAALKSNGESHSIGAGISYPFLRSRVTNLTGSAAYSFKALTDYASSTTIRDKRLNSVIFSCTGDRFDTLLGGGYTSWNAGVTLGNLREDVANISITNSEGFYSHVNYGVARLQRLADQLSLNLSYSGQQSFHNLDSSEKFNLGGPSGIRAYPVGEASGDEGHLFNIDLKYDIPVAAGAGSVQSSLFYDAGYIRQHHELWANSVATATNDNGYWLQGAGVGVSFFYNNTFSLKTSWAHTLGDNPGRSTSGKDSDGLSDNNRFWLQATIIF